MWPSPEEPRVFVLLAESGDSTNYPPRWTTTRQLLCGEKWEKPSSVQLKLRDRRTSAGCSTPVLPWGRRSSLPLPCLPLRCCLSQQALGPLSSQEAAKQWEIPTQEQLNSPTTHFSSSAFVEALMKSVVHQSGNGPSAKFRTRITWGKSFRKFSVSSAKSGQCGGRLMPSEIPIMVSPMRL